MRPAKRILAIIFVVLFSFLILGFLELAARVIDLPRLLAPRRAAIEMEMPAWIFIEQNTESRFESFVEDPRSLEWLTLFEEGDGFRVRLVPGVERRVTNTLSRLKSDLQRPYLIKANDIGFRGADLKVPKPKDHYRILVFGDSSSFGLGVNEDETYHEILAGFLRKRLHGKTVEVGNFAIPGDSSEYGRLVMDRFIRDFQPDMTIISFGANDARPVLYYHQGQVERFRKSMALHRLRGTLRKSHLFRSMLEAARSLDLRPQAASAPQSQRVIAVPMDRYTQNLNAMVQQAKEAGSEKVVLVSVCVPKNYAGLMAKVGSDMSVYYFDGQHYLIHRIDDLKSQSLLPEMVTELESRIAKELSREDAFYITSDGCHPNQIGNRLMAEGIYELVEGEPVSRDGGSGQ